MLAQNATVEDQLQIQTSITVVMETEADFFVVNALQKIVKLFFPLSAAKDLNAITTCCAS